ncbi:hypothetical protein GSI_09005 [Ganoderma sinense ZZ0214-1]|uniref:Uncharacterized protein n=1 Tax=Ganoderma sinense ZZ0214-1 TaxID=1077348 RepID=A0A2G8S5Z5_9APHY|nr:hypothetical protein GSI_09005 [Ganoderma sinense ZZ0214-1]
MQPNGLLLLLEEPYLGPSRSGANIRGMVQADALRHKLKVAQRYYKIREYLAARKELPAGKRAREPSPVDEDAMVVDDAAPVQSPLKRGRFEAPRSMLDRPLRRLATSMRVRVDSGIAIRLAMRQERGTVQVVLKSTRPLQPAIRPRWRPNDTRPKFSVASLAQTDEDFLNPLSYHYALHLRLRPQEADPRHTDLLHHPNLGDIYVTPIDTADGIYWFIQDEFTIVDPLHSPQDTPPVEIAPLESSRLLTAGELGIGGPDEDSDHNFGGDGFDFSFNFELPTGSGGASYDVSLSRDTELQGPAPAGSALVGPNPPPVGAGESMAGSSSAVASNVLTCTAEELLPTRGFGDSDHSVSRTTVSDPLVPSNVTGGAASSGNATEHVQARIDIRIDHSRSASRVAVAPSDVAITQPCRGEASKSSQAEGAAREGTVECQTSPDSAGEAGEGASSSITHLAQESTDITGFHSPPGTNEAKLEVSTEGVLELTDPLFTSELGTERGSQRRLSQSPAPFTMRHLFKQTIPPGAADVKDTQEVLYGDGGNALISRWSIQDASVCFEFPSWCWNKNAEDATSLELPRILAHQVNPGLVAQQWDGNFGLAVPGWRYPWTNSDDLKPEDQVTFYDVLQHNDDVRVDKPWIMTLRLLWPREQSRSPGKARETAPVDRTRSFVYFGDGEPCAILGSSDTEPIAPQWGPRIIVWPQSPDEGMYTNWRLRLLSMTLLKPLRDDPDYTNTSHWEAIELKMPAARDSSRSGVEIILDTCASRSHFPPEVIDSIVRLWLKDSHLQEYEDGEKAIYVERPEDYENFDIEFKFLGGDQEVTNFRCGARDFLVSPYKVDDCGYYCPFAELGKIDHLVSPFKWCTLGTNFFWCAMTRLVAPLHDGTKGGWELTRAERPYVQLAPQRIVRDGRKMAGPRDFKIYEEYPPWFQPGKHEPMYMNH